MKNKINKETKDKQDRSFLLKIALLMFAIVLALYGGTLENGYSMDDEYVVYKNEQVQKGITAIPEIFTSRYATAGEKAYGYRPIVKSTFAIEQHVFGEKPAVSHFINLLLYSLTGLLLFVILKRLFHRYHHTFPLLITVLFLAHPLHSEVVSSLKNRDELLSFLFALSALYCSINYTESKKVKFLAYTCLLMGVSLLAKPSSLTFIALIPLALFYFTKATMRNMAAVTGALLLGTLLARLFVASMVGGTEGGRDYLFFENPLYTDGSFILRIKAATVSLYFYLKMLFIPHPLVAYYGYDQVSFDDWNNPLVLGVCAAGAAMGIYALYRARQKEAWGFGVLFTLIALSMYLNLVVPAVGIVAERFAYVASLGFCIVIAWLLWRLAGAVFERSLLKQLSWKWLPLAVILILFLASIINRTGDWKDHLSLYTADIKKAPRSAKLNALLATQYAYSGKLAEAKKHYEASLDIYPDYATSLNNLGLIKYVHDHDTLAAIKLWQRAVKADPYYPDAYYNLAMAEDASKKYAAAEAHYKEVIKINSDFKKAYEHLGLLYARAGRYDEVLEMSKAALGKGVVADILHINIGNVMMVKGDTAAAVASFEKGIAINSKNPGLCRFLGSWFALKGDHSKARYYNRLAMLQ